jgi:MarR family transcriptional regulator, 2-MHQ and catechol-resistance regulon repressor
MPTHYPGTQKEILALDTFIKLNRACDSVLGRLSQRGTHGDLSPSQFGALESLYHLGPMCQTEVATKLLKSGGNITMVIDNLEKRGLVHRDRDPEDRRMIVVSLTEAGSQLISQLFPCHVASIVEELGVLTAEELQTLGQLCRKLGKREQSG